MDIQAGYYKARAILGSEQLGKTKSGIDQVALDIELVEGEYKGRRLTTFLFFSDDAAPFALERLRACGWTGGNDFAGIDRNEVTVQVKYETYEGKQQLKVDIATGGGRVVLKEQMNEGEKRGFFAKLNQLAQQGAAPPPAANASGGKGYPESWDTNAPKQPPPRL